MVGHEIPSAKSEERWIGLARGPLFTTKNEHPSNDPLLKDAVEKHKDSDGSAPSCHLGIRMDMSETYSHRWSCRMFVCCRIRHTVSLVVSFTILAYHIVSKIHV